MGLSVRPAGAGRRRRQRSRRATAELLSQAFRFPAGRPLGSSPPSGWASRRRLRASPARASCAPFRSRFAYGVRVHAPGWTPDDDAFCVEPGGRRDVLLHAPSDGRPFGAALTALNLEGRVGVGGAA